MVLELEGRIFSKVQHYSIVYRKFTETILFLVALDLVFILFLLRFMLQPGKNEAFK